MNTIVRGTDMLPMYPHQIHTAEVIRDKPRVFVTSDPGTGKTRSVLEGFLLRRAQGEASRMLVFAPLSILRPAWGNDIRTWAPSLTYGFSTYGSDKKRLAAFEDGCDIVITNHDAVKWVLDNIELTDDFDTLVIDESTAFKHATSARSKAMKKLAKNFPNRILMSGTPTSNTICDIWHQAMILDDGDRLGKMFHGFRMQVCTPVQAGPRPEMVKWVDKPGAEEIVAERLRDITVRYRFEDCIDVPENTLRTMTVMLPPKLMAQYHQLEKEALLDVGGARINAVHAAAKTQKLLQLCSGAVYDEDHVAQVFDTDRYHLVMQLVEERDHSIVVFNWRHQRDQLTRLADQLGISYAVIDGETKEAARPGIIDAYQAGAYRTIFLHPQSAAHGLTLTRGRATIWASPTYNAEWFQQINARIYRAGQTKRTETIMIAADGTKEPQVYEALQDKRQRMFGMLDIFTALTGEHHANND